MSPVSYARVLRLLLSGGHGNAIGIVGRVTERLQQLLREAFPDANEVAVEDRTGGGDHFQVTVASPRFRGLSLVEQHRLVYDALAAPLADGTIHELRIKTRGDA
jgi:stress-induced morphogen